jgi:NTE family protein
MTKPKTQPLPIALGLQGGAVHAAFAWGALEVLLSSPKVGIESISATSGGAVQAVVLADGYARGGEDAAREHLYAFWKKISLSMQMLPLARNPMAKFLGDVGIDFSPQTIALDYITKLFSPSQFNLFDLNPLKGIIEEMVDFKRVNAMKELKLFINTTEVKTGKSRVFSNGELSLEVVMASCCLPYFFKTVEINGEGYWDGAYSGNPRLAPLMGGKAKDIVLVQTVPPMSDDVPARAPDIMDRVSEISFNTPLALELEAISLSKAARVHTIEANDVLASLGRASKLNGDWEFIQHLYDLGIQAAQDWVAVVKG